MTKQSFDKILQPLVDVFGEKQYSGRMHLIFEHVKDLSENALKRIVRDFLETRSVYEPPMPRDFHHEAQKLKGTASNRAYNKPDCFELQPQGDTLQRILKEHGVKSWIELNEKIKKRERGA